MFEDEKSGDTRFNRSFNLDGDDEQGGDIEEDAEPDEEEELAAAAERGEVCAECGEAFTEANSVPSLCQDCFDAAEDAAVVDHPPLSKFPVRG